MIGGCGRSTYSMRLHALAMVPLLGCVGLQEDPTLDDLATQQDAVTATPATLGWSVGGAISVTNKTLDSVTIAWPAAILGTSPIATYTIYKDGVFFMNVAPPTLTATVGGLAAGTPVKLWVMAVSQSGQRSGRLQKILSPLAECVSGTETIPPQDPVEVPKPTYKIDFDSDDEITKNCVTNGGCAQITGTHSFPKGRVGKALQVGAVGQLDIPMKGVIDLDGAGSVELSIALKSSGNSPTGFAILQSPSSKGFLLRKNAYTDLQFFTKPPNNHWLAHSMKTWIPDQWHHVVLTWDAGSQSAPLVNLYVDGLLSSQKPRTDQFPTNADVSPVIQLAKDAADNYLVDEFRTYSVALSKDQVLQRSIDAMDWSGPELVAGKAKLKLLGGADGFGIGRLYSTHHMLAKLPRKRDLWSLHFEHASATQIVSVPHTTTVNGVATTTYKDEVVKVGVIVDNTLPAKTTACYRDGDTNEVRLTWNQVPLPGADLKPSGQSGSIDVAVTLTPEPAQNQYRASITVNQDSTEWRLLQTDFPRLDGLLPIGADPVQGALLVPIQDLGVRLASPFTAKFPENSIYGVTGVASAGLPYPSGHMAMQWTALYDRSTEKDGIYFAAEDGAGWLKALHWDQDLLAKTVSVALSTYAVNSTTSGNDHTPPWSVVFGVQDGSWFDFAKRYRNDFAKGQRWTSKGTLAKRMVSKDAVTRPANWLLNAGVLFGSLSYDIIFQHPNNKPSEGLKGVAEALGIPNSVMLWHTAYNHVAHQSKFATQFEDGPSPSPWLPGLPWIADARQSDIGVAGYLDIMSWDAVNDFADPFALSAANGEAFAKKDRNGKIVVIGDAPYAPPAPVAGKPVNYAVRMCPQVSEYQAVIAADVQAMVAPQGTSVGNPPIQGAGLSGGYLDEGAATDPRQCFDPAHGHALGGGSGHVDGIRTLLSAARVAAKAVEPDAGFYTESFAESFIDLVEGYWNWPNDPGVFDQPPMSIAVYHDYAVFIGREIQLARTDASVVAATAKEFSWGMMLGMVKFQPFLRPSVTERLLKLGHLRQVFQDYLVLGEMARPIEPVLVAAVGPQAVTVTGPLSGQAVPTNSFAWTTDQTNPTNLRSTPAVFVTQWRGPDGSAGIVVASTETGTTGRSYYIPIVRADLGFDPASPLVITNIDTKSVTPIGTLAGEGGVRVNIPPGGVVLIEVTKKLL